MNPKFYADCPCNGCPDRTADPNCHGENGHCPHGYLEWKAEAAKKKSQFDADKRRRMTQPATQSTNAAR